MLKGILVGAGIVLLVVASIGGTMVFTGQKAPEPGMMEGAPGLGAALPPSARPKVFYYDIQPEFVANLPGTARARYALLEMSVAVNDETAVTILDDNGPELRNNVLAMLSEQTADSLAGNDGKTALRAKTGEIVDELLTKHYGGGRVVDVYLTRFVIQ